MFLSGLEDILEIHINTNIRILSGQESETNLATTYRIFVLRLFNFLESKGIPIPDPEEIPNIFKIEDFLGSPETIFIRLADRIRFNIREEAHEEAIHEDAIGEAIKNHGGLTIFDDKKGEVTSINLNKILASSTTNNRIALKINRR